MGAPSQPSASPSSPPLLHVHGGASACASVVFCRICGAECGPDVETSYGKCQRCLDSAFHSFARSFSFATTLVASGRDARADEAAAEACSQEIPFINSSSSSNCIS